MINKNIAHCALTIGLASLAMPVFGQQHNGATDNPEARAAVALARTQLSNELKIDAGTIETLSSEPQSWPDSSLGCGRRGTQAAQVVTPGFAVLLKTPSGNYRVHAAANYAVVCGPATQRRDGAALDRGALERRGVGVPLKNINAMIEQAREDLAKKLGVPLASVRVGKFLPAQWPDSAMECPVAGEEIKRQPVRGYRIALLNADRTFVYHTDLARVYACPAIEIE